MVEKDRYLEINGCKHYFLNEAGQSKGFFIHSPYYVEIDVELRHPIGSVYKPKGCIDTPIRFVIQPNNSVLMFRSFDWNIPTNSFYKKPKTIFKANYLNL